MTDPTALSVSILALAISAITTWLTLFRRGTVRMTQPTVIYFGPDVPKGRGKAASPAPKIFLRTLMFSTSKRGRILENMYVVLTRDQAKQSFNVWVYGDRERLERGSGLFIGEAGITTNHHFLAPKGVSAFKFGKGRYRLDVFAHLLGDKKPKQLFTQALEITAECATDLKEPDAGLYFDWLPDASRYAAHIDNRPLSSDPTALLELLTGHSKA